MSFLDEKKGEGVGGRKKTRVFPSKKEQRWREEKKGEKPRNGSFRSVSNPKNRRAIKREREFFSSEPKEERSQKKLLRGVERLVSQVRKEKTMSSPRSPEKKYRFICSPTFTSWKGKKSEVPSPAFALPNSEPLLNLAGEKKKK